MTLLQEYRRQRALIRAKIIMGGYDPDAIILRARLRNWLQDVRHVLNNYALYKSTKRACGRGICETTRPEDVYATYDYEPCSQCGKQCVRLCSR
jgi:hypothetical protein